MGFDDKAEIPSVLRRLAERFQANGGELNPQEEYEELVKQIPVLRSTGELGEEIAQSLEDHLAKKDPFLDEFKRLMAGCKYADAATYVVGFVHLAKKIGDSELETLFDGVRSNRPVLDPFIDYIREHDNVRYGSLGS